MYNRIKYTNREVPKPPSQPWYKKDFKPSMVEMEFQRFVEFQNWILLHLHIDDDIKKDISDNLVSLVGKTQV